MVFELDAAALQAVDVPVFQEIPKFQAVTRDLALLVNQSVSVQNVLDVFNQECRTNPACQYVQAIVLFDEYRGKGLQTNEKSLAFRCTLQDTQSTLQDEVVEAAIAALLAAAQTQCDAKLRS